MSRQARVLLVEDNPLFREQFVKYFANQLTIEQAEDGVEALQKIPEGFYDLIVLDLNMPRMDGFEVLRDLQKRNLLDRQPVIVLSIYANAQTILSAVHSGAADYIWKQQSFDTWELAIRRVLEGQELKRQKRRAEEDLLLTAASVMHTINSEVGLINRASERVGISRDTAPNLERLTLLARNLTTLCRASGLFGMVKKDPVDLNAILAGLAAPFSDVYTNVRIQRELDPSLPWIKGSTDLLREALRNFVTNAGKAMSDGGTLFLRSQYQPTVGVVLQIRDTGIGMTEAQLQKIFSPGSAGHSWWPDGTPRGSGLGLIVSRRIINNHGGQMKFRSEVGQGTEVTVRFTPIHETKSTQTQEEGTYAGTQDG